MNGCFEETNKSKYLTRVPNDEIKQKHEKYDILEIQLEIRDLIKSKTKNSDDYDEKYMKMRFNLAHNLPLNKIIKIPCMIIVVRAIFHENNKYYSQFFLDECLYKL